MINRCSIDGCQVVVKARGLCNKHYRRLLSRGTTDPGMERVIQVYPKDAVCSVDGCIQPVHCKWLCGLHYSKSKSDGVIDRLVRSYPEDTTCSLEGCENPVAVKWLCRLHYQQSRQDILNERAKVRHAERMAADPEYAAKKLKSSRRWRTDHPEKQREASASWRERNSEKYAENQRKWRQKNDRSDYNLKWSRANRDKRAASSQKRRGARKGAKAELINRSIVWEEDGGICGICLMPADPNDWHLDHVIPLSRGGSHTYDNVQVSHPWCNLSKGNKLPCEME